MRAVCYRSLPAGKRAVTMVAGEEEEDSMVKFGQRVCAWLGVSLVERLLNLLCRGHAKLMLRYYTPSISPVASVSPPQTNYIVSILEPI